MRIPTTPKARLALGATLVLVLFSTPATAQQEVETPPPELTTLAESRRVGFDSIDPALCRQWLTYLASDELGGRGTGKPGYKLAADFVAARFKEFGLKPVGDDGTYFQNIPYFAVGADPEKSYLAVLGAEGKELLRVEIGKGLGGRIAENSDRDFELVELTAANTADVEAVDLEGKAVLFVDQSRAGRFGSEASRALRQAQAGAVITVDDKLAARLDERISRGDRGRDRVRSSRFRRLNGYAITTAVAGEIRALLAANDGKLRLKTRSVIVRRPVFGGNVVGLLEGSHPTLKQEIVGIGSHLDHIGSRGEVVNNGADDDGSGTTGVLAVARAFSKNPVKPRRSILFMCFAGEESGMIGSGFYTSNPIFPNEYMIAELQMDMIGRHEEKIDRRTGKHTEKAEDNLNSLHLVGSKKLSMDLHETCLRVNEAHIGFDFEFDEEGVFYRSDHVKFAQKDIPIAFFFTGFHPQYHRPDDTVDKIDFPKLSRVAQLVYSIAFEIGDAEKRVKRDRLWKDVAPPKRRRRGR